MVRVLPYNHHFCVIKTSFIDRSKNLVRRWENFYPPVLLKEKEAERSSLLEEHEELDNERKDLVEERAEIKANANQKANSAIN